MAYTNDYIAIELVFDAMVCLGKILLAKNSKCTSEELDTDFSQLPSANSVGGDSVFEFPPELSNNSTEQQARINLHEYLTEHANVRCYSEPYWQHANGRRSTNLAGGGGDLLENMQADPMFRRSAITSTPMRQRRCTFSEGLTTNEVVERLQELGDEVDRRIQRRRNSSNIFNQVISFLSGPGSPIIPEFWQPRR